MPAPDEQKGRVIGHGPCPNCSHTAAYKINKKSHVYVYCTTEADGGCHSGTQSRSDKGDKALAKRITKWSNAADKKRLVGGDAPPAKADDTPAEKPKESFWDRKLF